MNINTTKDINLKKDSSKLIFFNACFDKNQIKNLVSWYLNQYGERQTIKFLERLKKTGFHQATVAGISLGIEDLQIPPDKPNLITQTQIENQKIDKYITCGLLTNVEKSQYLIEIWNQTSDKLRQASIQNFKLKNPVNPVYMMAFSGARGNVSQVRQLIAMRGLMADPQGAILEFPIQSNFREGLTITEYLISCYGARKGLVDTALRTATSGYLTRRLVDSAQHAVISILDCKTSKYRTLIGNDLKNRLIGRVLARDVETRILKFSRNQIITPKIATLITDEYNQINVRSPLTCQSTTSICQLCYGWSLSSGKVVQVGEAVGVIAAQSIGEPGTQLTMRTFHTGGVGVFSDQALKPIHSPYAGKVVFSKQFPGHFVRTPKGNIVYMLKYNSDSNSNSILEIQSDVNPTLNFKVYTHQLPSGSILLVKHGQYIQPKQLIAQASYIKITKQQLPESSYPVYAPKTGQVFYESMNLVIEKEKLVPTDLPIQSLNPKLFNNLNINNIGLSEIRRMATIGSFWILSSSKQQKILAKQCFVKPGDLISKKTIISNYSFFSKYTNYIQLINNSLAFGISSIQLPITDIVYKQGYLIYKLNKKDFGFFIHKKYSLSKNVLLWYLNKTFFENEYFFKSSLLFKDWSKVNKSYLPQGIILYSQQNRNSVSTSLSNKGKYQVINPTNQIRFKGKSHIISHLLLEKKFIKNQTISSNLINFDKKLKQWPILLNNPISKTDINEIIPPGRLIYNFAIPKFYIHLKKYGFKSTQILEKKKNWYNQIDLITNTKFLENTKINNNYYCFNQPTIKYKNICWVKRNLTLSSQLYKNTPDLSNCIYIQQFSEHAPHTKKEITNKLTNITFKSKSYFFNKQVATKQIPIKYPNIKYEVILNKNLQQNLYKFRFIFKSKFSSNYKFNLLNYKFLSKYFIRGLNIFHYYSSSLKRPNLISFKLNKNLLALHSTNFASGIIHSEYMGEFIYQLEKRNSSSINLLTTQNLTNILLSNMSLQDKQIGSLVRYGDEIECGIGSTLNGQIIKKNKKFLTLRLGTPILASARGIIHVNHNDLVDKNQLIVTLKSRRLQTEDIVQGIPKIEQLFEARESQSGEILNDTVHLRLRTAFVQELELLNNEHWSHAVDRSFLEAQTFLVENIEAAYSNQGVKISEKHIEVIVRQMTNRVRILESGETGLLPGELVQHSWIKKFNSQISQIGLREATYEPIVLGISKSVLQSESFLLAASFQEVSRVLIKSSLSKKRDFLKGLHENVIVGQAIPAGTGLIAKRLIE